MHKQWTARRVSLSSRDDARQDNRTYQIRHGYLSVGNLDNAHLLGKKIPKSLGPTNSRIPLIVRRCKSLEFFIPGVSSESVLTHHRSHQEECAFVSHRSSERENQSRHVTWQVSFCMNRRRRPSCVHSAEHIILI
jgi:hypothetical protein